MRSVRGFTLIELMIVIAVVAILAAIAIPVFTEQLRKSRRAEATRGLSDLQLRQEKWRNSHATYVGTDSSATDKTGLGLPISDFYDFSLDSTASGTGFKVKAVAKAAQADDTGCATMTLQVAGSTVTKSPTTGRCWN
jgi:type IV pilus assembly protein PilE